MNLFKDLFNASLRQHTVPACFKAVAIIPVPKKPNIKALNDFRPLALTSVVMKVLERLVLVYLKSVTISNMDPLQFAYRENRCTDDAAALAPHFVMQHLESPDRYVRILLLQFRLQHGHPSETVRQTSSAVTRLINVLLASGLFNTAITGC